jgi:hypothetical protein
MMTSKSVKDGPTKVHNIDGAMKTGCHRKNRSVYSSNFKKQIRMKYVKK